MKTILAYEVNKNLDSTGKEKVLEVRSIREAAKHIANETKGIISRTGTIVYTDNGNSWHFEILKYSLGGILNKKYDIKSLFKR